MMAGRAVHWWEWRKLLVACLLRWRQLNYLQDAQNIIIMSRTNIYKEHWIWLAWRRWLQCYWWGRHQLSSDKHLGWIWLGWWWWWGGGGGCWWCCWWRWWWGRQAVTSMWVGYDWVQGKAGRGTCCCLLCIQLKKKYFCTISCGVLLLRGRKIIFAADIF